MTLPELDAIKARAADGEPLRHGDLTKLLTALEGVMELHKEVGNAGIDGCECGCGDYEPWCSCGQGDYPCPTVATVERALKEEQ